MAAHLPASVGVIVTNLPRGGDGVPVPRRVSAAADIAVRGLRSLDLRAGERLVLVGNSYGALLAYETAWRLCQAGVPVERLIVSGFRSPRLHPADAPLHRLPSDRLWAEVTARYGVLPGAEALHGDPEVEACLRADLEACETYRHDHDGRLAVPLDVLCLLDDPCVSEDELAAWRSVTTGPVRLIPQAGGHFPWATAPEAMAATLVDLAEGPAGPPFSDLPTSPARDKL